LASSPAEKGTCLVTGVRAPIRVLHAYIDSIASPGKPRPKLIAIDKDNDAFASYGKEQGANAPVSERAAHAYATALNALLSKSGGTDPKTKRRKWTNRVQIGDATTVFWAEAGGGPQATSRAEKAENLFATLLDPPTDEQEASKLQQLLHLVEQGRPFDEVDPALDKATRFYVLGLSPNAARLSVRFFLRSTLGELVAHSVEHYHDLSITPPVWTTPPPAWRLLRETAVQHDAGNVSPALAGEVARAILTGGRYPRSLLAQTIMRVRADGEINGLRIAIAKACIVRSHRKDIEQNSPDPEEDVPVALDRSETNPGYRLGRLFYVLENAQRLGIGRVNATIRDKFYASASANPARVFPLLLRGAQDHIGAVRRKSGGGLAFWLDEQIAEIVGGLSSSTPFPPTLRLEDQGRFLVGYYHQRNAAKAEGKTADDLPDTNQGERSDASD
jgi:CRISPR-associated protein Csd1